MERKDRKEIMHFIDEKKVLEALNIIEKELNGTTEETMVPRRDTLDGSRSSELRTERPSLKVRARNTERDSRDIGGGSE